MNQREKEEKRQLWIARLCNLEESGLTQDDWCKDHSIPYSTLRYWINKLKKEAETEKRDTNWLKVDMTSSNEIASVRIPDPSGSNGEIHIRYGDFTVLLQNDYPPQRVFELLRMLKSL